MKVIVQPLPGHGASIHIPDEIVQPLLERGVKRVICTIDDIKKLHVALHKKDDQYYIMLGKQVAKEHDIIPFDKVEIRVEEDNSKYQFHIPEELESVMNYDEEGNVLFHKLTPGKQRSLMHQISRVKSKDLRIEKSLLLMENLKKGLNDLKLLLKG